MQKKEIKKIVLIGTPNCGKTTIFNALTGKHQYIGNWPGVTVKTAIGTFNKFKNIILVDTPGLYTLSSSSEQQDLDIKKVLSESDLVINVLAASNIQQNLFLTLSLREAGIPMIVLITMADIARKESKYTIQTRTLSRLLAVPILGIHPHNKNDIQQATQFIFENIRTPYTTTKTMLTQYPDDIEKIIEEYASIIHTPQTPQVISDRFLALSLLEKNNYGIKKLHDISKSSSPEEEKNKPASHFSKEHIQSMLDAIVEHHKCSIDILLQQSKVSTIQSILRKIIDQYPHYSSRKNASSLSEKIDRIVLHKYLGIPLFFLILYILFGLTIHIGNVFTEFFTTIASALFVESPAFILNNINAPDWITRVISQGMGRGVQTVFSFIPIMFPIFFMLTILRSSGYMARIAYIMDRVMRRLGLPGNAFIPMMIGFGCTVPAIMATDTLEHKKDRYFTMFLTPFMSCGARFSVYVLFGLVFFERHAGLMAVSLYVIGILMAVGTGLIVKKSLFNAPPAPLIMELPHYHLSSLTYLLKISTSQLRFFLKGTGKTIILLMFFLSALGSIPITRSVADNDSSPLSLPMWIGKTSSPLFTPLGIEKENWPAVLALMTGGLAKEVIVATLNNFYPPSSSRQDSASELQTNKPENPQHILSGLLQIAYRSVLRAGQELFSSFSSRIHKSTATPASSNSFFRLRAAFNNDWVHAYAYLLFVLLYFPCVAVLSVLIKKTNLLFTILAVLYPTVLAWSVSTLFFQIMRAHNLWLIVTACAMMLAFIPLFHIARKSIMR